MRRNFWIALLLCLGLTGCAVPPPPSFLRSASEIAVHIFAAKPLALVNMNGRWSTELLDAAGKPHLDWVERFRKNNGSINAQTVFDYGEVFVIILQNRSAEFPSDKLSRQLDLDRRIEKMRLKDTDQDVVIEEVRTFRMSNRWPFLRWQKERYVLVFVEGSLSKYQDRCHADLVTAWATKGASSKALIERCKLDN